eukprot:TRINITY_DN537_c2_g2_i2.p1 TRINITY_DN537_c2_g2~~TRINITY_DN537_c2_g2_i2.p1  ORF type:complete len:333 (-),score=131.09 TRINITY_DN537_c2_g2_i2:148-1146(-)
MQKQLIIFFFFLNFFTFSICFNVDKSKISVSGFSSGAYWAVQYQIAFSSQVTGAAIFAGGPYYCSQGSSITASTTCMQLAYQIDTSKLVKQTNQFADQNLIDQPSNISNHNIFLFSATLDTVVHQDVVRKLEDYYKQLNSKAKITTKFNLIGEHTYPTLHYGELCTLLFTPFIGWCDYDGAGNALEYSTQFNLYSPGNPSYSNIMELKQSNFAPEGRQLIGFAEKAFVYIPKSCQQNTKCALHIALHGCSQNYHLVGNAFYYYAGYNRWAESNNIIILYPQAEIVLPGNPEGCFDWWGFSGQDFAFKSSVQMTTVNNMIDYLSNSSITKIDF